MHDYIVFDMKCFVEKENCVFLNALRELLVKEARGEGHMGHFEEFKTYGMLHKHFYWLKMRKDVDKVCR